MSGRQPVKTIYFLILRAEINYVTMSFWSRLFGPDHKPRMGGLEIFKYIGPGLLVTVGFIDPGNWASNLAAGAQYGYTLLWMVTLSTVMLIVLQHNVAHLGIATGLCLSEAASAYLKPAWSRPLLGSAVLASISTSLAEILGGAIALQMLFGVPVRIGALLVLVFVVVMLFTNSYRLIENGSLPSSRSSGCRSSTNCRW